VANLPVEKLPATIGLSPITAPFNRTIRPPGSKSLTNRALLLAALAEGASTLTGALAEADDAVVMLRALQQLGVQIELSPQPTPGGLPTGNAKIRVTGVGGRWKIAPGSTVTLDLNNAGTATRFLTAAALLAPSDTTIIIDGNARMRQRPIADLVEALVTLGARIDYLGTPGCPPLRIRPPAHAISDQPINVALGAASSSQFLSALLMSAVHYPRPTVLHLTESIPSASYLHMTMKLMAACIGPQNKSIFEISGLTPDFAGTRIKINPLRASAPAFFYPVEPDASGAAYFLAAAALCRSSSMTIDALKVGPHNSLQGDSDFAEYLTAAVGASSYQTNTGVQLTGTGTINPVRAEFHQMPDQAMTAAVIACFALHSRPNDPVSHQSIISGLTTLRVKETDRIEALRIELAKIGVSVRPFARGGDEGIVLVPPSQGIDCSTDAPPVFFDTYDDHRMAMSLALVGLRRPNVFINNPGCVAKTYPTFWRDFASLGMPATKG
jgi:3-phosphoshikimate 1-carboxyvinyltransferase